MRILVATADYPPIEGGISTLSAGLARALAAQGHEVTVLAPHFPGMAEFDAGEPVRVVRFRGYGLGPLRLAPFLWAGRALAAHCDLLIAINVAYGGVLGRWHRAVRGVPYVCLAYGYEFLKYRNAPLAAWALRRIYRGARHCIAISGYTRAQLKTFAGPGLRCSVVLPGADGPREIDGDAAQRLRGALGIHGDPMVLAVGRFIARKGHLQLVDALPRVHERRPNVHLVMAGRGPLRAACIARARALGIEGHVHCPGYVDEAALAAYYGACDVFALPAGEAAGGQVEGFGLVFAEAHAYGKPVVAGRSGGTPEAVLDGETGLLTAADDAESLAAALVRLLTDPALARRMGEAGRRRVIEELNWKTFTERLMAAAGR